MKNKFIPYARQSLNGADIRAVLGVLRSDWLTQGPKIAEFEEAFAKYCGARYAVAVSNGTAGLHLACWVAGLKSGDEAITSPLTFVATANAIVYCGARSQFADIEEKSLGLDPGQISANDRTKAILPVHFAGHPCRIGKKSDFSKRKDLFVIEDACHALGAEYGTSNGWKKIGNCENTDMAVFSFHPAKHVTTGEGGMITTNRRDLYEKLKRLRTHGIEKEAQNFVLKDEPKGPWYYEMQDLGFNYRITDIQCALGISQLKKIDSFVRKRRAIANFYHERFKNIEGLKIPVEADEVRSSYHLYVLRVNFEEFKSTRAEWMKKLKEAGIGTQVHYIPVTRQPYYVEKWATRPGDYPVCEKVYKEVLSIPLFPSMSLSDAKRVAKAIERLCRRN